VRVRTRFNFGCERQLEAATEQILWSQTSPQVDHVFPSNTEFVFFVTQQEQMTR
jgi:hypothetical protein